MYNEVNTCRFSQMIFYSNEIFIVLTLMLGQNSLFFFFFKIYNRPMLTQIINQLHFHISLKVD